jgi:hypothetical protein
LWADFMPAAGPLRPTELARHDPAEHGIEQLDDLGVLQVPPLAALGSPAEIAARFGSIRELSTP